MGERLDVLEVHVSEAISYTLHVIQAVMVIVRIHSIGHHCLPIIQGPIDYAVTLVRPSRGNEFIASVHVSSSP